MLHGMGEPIQRGARRPGPPGPGLHALRGDAAGHGLPGPPAPGKHVERVVPEGQLHRAAPGRRPAAQPRGDRSHVRPRTDGRSPQAAPRPPSLPPFRNEPPTDFTRAETREAMRAGARGRPRTSSGRPYPLADRRPRRSTPADDVSTRSTRATRSRIVGRFAMAGAEHAERGRRGRARGLRRPGRRRPPATGPAVLLRAADDHAAATVRAGRLGGLRVRQALARGRRRRRRGDRLLRVLRPRDDPPGRAAAPRRPGRDQRHRAHRRGASPSSSPPGTSRWRSRLRHDRRRPGRRQHGRAQAGRAVAGHRLAPRPRSSARPGLPAGRPRATCPAAARRSARPWSTTPAST